MALAILTGALVFITGFYAWFTFRIMKANERTVATIREQSDSLIRPYVNIGVFTVPNSVLLYLRVVNTGKTSAENVRLTLDKDFYQYGQKGGTNLRTITAFQETIGQLPPGAEMIFGLAQGYVILGDKADPSLTPPVFSIAATYSYGDKSVSENTVIDLRPYRVSTATPSAIADELKRIREEVTKIAKK